VADNTGNGPKLPSISTGINNTKNGGAVQTGNRIQVLVGGQVVGLVQSMQCADDYGVQPATKIGQIEAVELVPLEANHTITVSMMMLSQDNLYQTADGTRLIPESGQNNPKYNDAIKGLEMDIVVRSMAGDSSDGKLLVMYRKCVYSSGSIDIQAQRIVISSATFRATHRVGLFKV
jgi:hypothetical protein